MKNIVFFSILLIFASCKNKDNPTTPDIPDMTDNTHSGMPQFVNRIVNYHINHPFGSTLTIGDTLEYSITYEEAEDNLWSGLAWTREDGEVYFVTSAGGGNAGLGSLSSSITFSQSSGLYKFGKEHRISGLFVIGRNPIMGASVLDPDGFVVTENVLFQEELPFNLFIQ